MALQHLRSSTANKRPTPAGMSDGQLALNTNDGSPGLFFKDSNGALVKVGPVHVGTTAPNATPGAGGSSGNAIGEQWLDTTGGTYVFKVWDGSAWRSETGTFVDVNGDVMTGALGIIAGSAGSPGLYFSGDTNTGIYSPGADQVAISTNSTGRLFVDSSGRVGVGSTAFASRVTVKNPAVSGEQNIFSVEGATSSATLFSLTTNQTDDTTKFFNIVNGPITFGTNNTERLRITAAGNVGIGTTSPATALEVASGTWSDSQLRVGSSTQAGRITLRRGSDGVVAGVLGWSSATDDTILELTNTGGDSVLRLNAGATSSSLSSLRFNVANTERARIDSSGRLLVGTSSSPSAGTGQYALSVVQGYAGSATGEGILSLARGKVATAMVNTDTIGQILFTDNAGNTFSKITSFVDGTVSSTSDLPGALAFSTTADGASSPTERMRITNSGVVKIGDSLVQRSGGVDVSTFGYDPGGGAGTAGQVLVVCRGNDGAGSFQGVALNRAATSWSTYSDERLKTDLVAIDHGLDKVATLRSVTGRYLTDDPSTSRSFLIAQDVQAVLPEAVGAEDPDKLSLRYTEVIPLLVSALKESKERIENLEAKVAALSPDAGSPEG